MTNVKSIGSFDQFVVFNSIEMSIVTNIINRIVIERPLVNKSNRR